MKKKLKKRKKSSIGGWPCIRGLIAVCCHRFDCICISQSACNIAHVFFLWFDMSVCQLDISQTDI